MVRFTLGLLPANWLVGLARSWPFPTISVSSITLPLSLPSVETNPIANSRKSRWLLFATSNRYALPRRYIHGVRTPGSSAKIQEENTEQREGKLGYTINLSIISCCHKLVDIVPGIKVWGEERGNVSMPAVKLTHRRGNSWRDLNRGCAWNSWYRIRKLIIAFDVHPPALASLLPRMLITITPLMN